MSNHRSSTNTALVVVAVMFCFVVAGCVAVFIAVPEGANTGSLIALLLGSLTSTLAAVATLVQVARMQVTQVATNAKVDKVAQDTHALTNGLLDSKVRAGVARTVHPDLLHPDVAETIVADEAAMSAYEDDRPEA